jgi:hypothetical protein
MGAKTLPNPLNGCLTSAHAIFAECDLVSYKQIFNGKYSLE